MPWASQAFLGFENHHRLIVALRVSSVMFTLARFPTSNFYIQ
jgi:hypothetical protein